VEVEEPSVLALPKSLNPNNETGMSETVEHSGRGSLAHPETYRQKEVRFCSNAKIKVLRRKISFTSRGLAQVYKSPKTGSPHHGYPAVADNAED
jgi:hypothetical protein